jgi:hypothetical protein
MTIANVAYVQNNQATVLLGTLVYEEVLSCFDRCFACCFTRGEGLLGIAVLRTFSVVCGRDINGLQVNANTLTTDFIPLAANSANRLENSPMTSACDKLSPKGEIRTSSSMMM